MSWWKLLCLRQLQLRKSLGGVNSGTYLFRSGRDVFRESPLYRWFAVVALAQRDVDKCPSPSPPWVPMVRLPNAAKDTLSPLPRDARYHQPTQQPRPLLRLQKESQQHRPPHDPRLRLQIRRLHLNADVRSAPFPAITNRIALCIQLA